MKGISVGYLILWFVVILLVLAVGFGAVEEQARRVIGWLAQIF